MYHLKRLAIITIFAILATACAPQQPITGDVKPPTAPKSDTQNIDRLLAQAKTAPALKAAQIKLQVAKLLILKREYGQVSELLNGINLLPLPGLVVFNIAILKGEAAITMEQLLRAQRDLANLPQNIYFSSKQLQKKYLLLASIHGKLNQLDKEVTALIIASEYTLERDALLALNENIWQVFKTLSIEPLQQLASNPNNSYRLRGWLSLMLSFKATPNSEKILANEWHINWRAHTAAQLSPLELADYLSKEPLLNSRYDFAHVLVALPESGKYAKGAAAILSGIKLAAAAPQNSAIQVSYIDTAVHNSAAAILEKASQLAADAIIGPIDKDIVSQFAQIPVLAMPVLALNSAAIANSNLYQFSLGNDDEVRDAAFRAFNDGRRSMLVLVPDGGTGELAANTFTDTFNSLGGEVADTTYYDTKTGNVTQAIAKMLKLDQGRIREMQKKLKTVHLRGTIRGMTRVDVDGIFLFANISDAYQIGPNINYFYADNLPLYATSKIYSGANDAVKDIDLNGMMFGDLPWVLSPGPNKQKVAVTESNTQKRIGRLYAFGIDAFNLAPNLYNLATQAQLNQAGDTGSIKISAENIVQKTLTWAKFVDGVPTLINAQ